MLLLPLSKAHAINWDFDAFTSFGVGRATVKSTGSAKPHTVQFQGGGAVGVSPFRLFSVGALSDYRLINQVTEVNTTWGNRTGTRWNQLSPYVDINFKPLRFRLSYQFLGDYKLSNATSGSRFISYGSPMGFKGEVHFCAVRGKERFYKIPGKCLFYLGVYGEQVKFKTESVGSVSTPARLADPLVISHIGLIIGLGI